MPAVAAPGGRIFKVMGDGVLVEFASAVNAVRCAIELQRAMAERERRPARRPAASLLRIGINLGDVIVEGSDLYGDGVNIAARLESLAEPGGICVSGDVYRPGARQARSAVPGSRRTEGQEHRAAGARLSGAGRRRRAGGVTGARSAAPALPDKPSIAVLPFTNMSGDPEQEYFADGMVEDIITALSRIQPAVRHRPQFELHLQGPGRGRASRSARELGVRYVLEGSVRKAGNRVRITGQLIDAATGAHLWADRFDGGLEDVFELQDRITGSVVGAIEPTLRKAEIERARRRPSKTSTPMISIFARCRIFTPFVRMKILPD